MPTPSVGSHHEKLALEAFIKLLRAAESVSRNTRGVIDQAGLTESRFGVLECLYHLGPLTPSELGRKILKSPSNLTLVLDNLARDGMIERCSAPDRRRRPVSITPAGRSLIKDLLPEHVRGIAAAFQGLTPKELENLAALCRKLGHSLPDPMPTKGDGR